MTEPYWCQQRPANADLGVPDHSHNCDTYMYIYVYMSEYAPGVIISLPMSVESMDALGDML